MVIQGLTTAILCGQLQSYLQKMELSEQNLAAVTKSAIRRRCTRISFQTRATACLLFCNKDRADER